jgi:farnesyl diphosphate synthase
MNGYLDFSQFTQENYRKIAQCKTSFVSYYLPIALGLLLADIDPKVLRDDVTSEKIWMDMGLLHHAREDYNNSQQHLERGKLGWPILVALKMSNTNEKRNIEASFGSTDRDSVNRVLHYNRFDMEDKWHEYEDKTIYEIKGLINQLKSRHLRHVFNAILNK